MKYCAQLLILLFIFISLGIADDTSVLPEKYRKWLDEEVVYIISEQERDIFLKLADDHQRDRFIQEFWEQRDPSPGTEKNEFKEEHYSRIEYANKFLGRETAKPGWKTDRGRIYIQLGKAKQIKRYDSHQKLMPMEIWFYQGDIHKGIPAFFYCIFFKKYGAGEYILYTPGIHGPEDLIFLNASQSELQAPRLIAEYDIELAKASINLVPIETTMLDGYNGRPSLTSITLMAQLENMKNYRRDASYAERILLGKPKVETMYTFDREGIPMDMHVIKMPNGIPVLNYAFYLPGPRLELGQYYDDIYSALEYSLSVMTEDEKPLISITKPLEHNYSEDEIPVLQKGGYHFEGSTLILPGRYTVTLSLKNKVSKVFYTKTKEMFIPYRESAALELMEPVLFPLNKVGDKLDAAKVPPYKFDNIKFLPLLFSKLQQGQSLGVFFQLILPTGADLSGENHPEVTYILKDSAGSSAWEVPAPAKVLGVDQFGVVSFLWKFDTSELTPDEKYHLEVVAEFGNDMIKTSSREFSVNKSIATAVPLQFFEKPLNFNGVEVYISQASQLAALEQYDIAIQLLEPLVKNYLSNEELQKLYIACLENAGKRDQLESVLKDMAIRFPENSEYKLRLGTLYLELGKLNKSIGYLEQIRLTAGDSVEVLNPLAEAYSLSGDKEKAAELLRRSLEIDSSQSSIQEKLSGLEN